MLSVCDVPTAAVRHTLRAPAGETGPQAGLGGVRLLRPLAAQAHEVSRERLEAGGVQSRTICAAERFLRTAWC
jgi:hypothetical protein